MRPEGETSVSNGDPAVINVTNDEDVDNAGVVKIHNTKPKKKKGPKPKPKTNNNSNNSNNVTMITSNTNYALAISNIPFMFVTEAVFHILMSWLNAFVSENIVDMLVTALVFQEPMF